MFPVLRTGAEKLLGFQGSRASTLAQILQGAKTLCAVLLTLVRRHFLRPASDVLRRYAILPAMTKKIRMTDSEYAKHRSVARQTVDRWRKRGFLGGIHVKASDAILNSRASNYRGGTASKRVGAPEQPGPDYADGASVSLAEAQRRKECALAMTREIALEKIRGNIVLMSDYEPSWARIMTAIRNAMLAVPGRARLTIGLDANQAEALRKLIHDALRAAAGDSAPPIPEQERGAA